MTRSEIAQQLYERLCTVLDEDVAYLAVCYWIEWFAFHETNLRVEDSPNPMVRMFPWKATEEGWDYWARLNHYAYFRELMP